MDEAKRCLQQGKLSIGEKLPDDAATRTPPTSHPHSDALQAWLPQHIDQGADFG